MGPLRTGRGAAIASITCLSFVAAAPVSAQRALFVDRGVGGDAVELQRAVERELDVPLVTPGTVRAELQRLAESARSGSTQSVREREREAVDAFYYLRFDRALARYDAAMEAVLASPVEPPDLDALARILLGRALVLVALQRGDDAERDLSLVLAIDPDFAPDPGLYGPPIVAALDAARARRAGGPTVTVEVAHAPRTASVEIDGSVLDEGATVASVARQSPHLLRVSQLGYVPHARIFDANDEARIEVVLPPASPAVTARQCLLRWDDPVDDAFAAAIGRALDLTTVVVAERGDAGEIGLRAIDPATGDVRRTASGDRVEWEELPFSVLAARLAGRTPEPPAPAEVSVTVTAPSLVEAGDDIGFSVVLTDPRRRVRSVAARCDHARVAEPATGSTRLGLAVAAPPSTGSVDCAVSALDAAGRVLGRATGALSIDVEPRHPTPWYGRWWFWTLAGTALVAGAIGAVLAATSDDPGRALRIRVNDGP